jgi:hypothetical protein
MSSFYKIDDLFGLADCTYRFSPSCYALLLCGVSSPISHVTHLQARSDTLTVTRYGYGKHIEAVEADIPAISMFLKV